MGIYYRNVLSLSVEIDKLVLKKHHLDLNFNYYVII